jgi:RNA polymerase sigma factor (sigma-70 family)
MTAPAMCDEPTIFVVAEATVVETVKQMAGRRDLRVKSCPCLNTLLTACTDLQPGCLLCEPGGTASRKPPASARLGLWFQELACRRISLPVILLGSNWTVPLVVQAMRFGAFNVLEKPCPADALWAAVDEALAWDRQNRSQREAKEKLRRRLARLTPGEEQVLQLLVEGMSNRDIAELLGLSVRAIEARRAKLMEKTRTSSLAELIRLVVAVRGG